MKFFSSKIISDAVLIQCASKCPENKNFTARAWLPNRHEKQVLFSENFQRAPKISQTGLSNCIVSQFIIYVHFSQHLFCVWQFANIFELSVCVFMIRRTYLPFPLLVMGVSCSLNNFYLVKENMKYAVTLFYSCKKFRLINECLVVHA